MQNNLVKESTNLVDYSMLISLGILDCVFQKNESELFRSPDMNCDIADACLALT